MSIAAPSTMNAVSVARLKRSGRESCLNQPKDSISAAVMKIPGVIVANAQP